MQIDYRDVAIDIWLNLFEEGFFVTEKVVLKIKLTIGRPFDTSQRHIKLHRVIWGKYSNGKLRILTLVYDGTLRSTTGFASALSNVNNVKIFDLLEFLLMLLFSFICYRQSAESWENIHGRDSFLIT